MKEVIDYKIIRGSALNMEDFVSAIRSAIKGTWQPYGNPIIGFDSQAILQVMVLYGEDELESEKN